MSVFSELAAGRCVYGCVHACVELNTFVSSCATCRKVTMATQKQLARLWHTTNIYMHPSIQEYAEKLTSFFPDPLKVLCFWQEDGLMKGEERNLFIRNIEYKSIYLINESRDICGQKTCVGTSACQIKSPQSLFFRHRCRQA